MQRGPMPAFTIAGKPAAFGDVEVHLKSEPRGATEPYEIVVPCTELEAVFDPHSDRQAGVSWPDYISANIQECGGFVLGGYIENMMKLNGEKTLRSLSVLATVDHVAERTGSIHIVGRIEEWCPEKYS